MAQLTKLSNLGELPNLEDLYCANSQGAGLSVLNISKLSKLLYLDARKNTLPVVNLSYNPLLEQVYLPLNNITSVNLEGLINLTNLEVRDNFLTSVDASSSILLIDLNASNNYNLTTINNYTNYTNLKYVRLSNTKFNDVNGMLDFLASGAVSNGVADFLGCDIPSIAGFASISTLLGRNWEVAYTPPLAAPKVEFTVVSSLNKTYFSINLGLSTNSTEYSAFGVEVPGKGIIGGYQYGSTSTGVSSTLEIGTYNGFVYSTDVNALRILSICNQLTLADVTSISGLENSPYINELYLENNALPEAVIDYILVTLDSNAQINGTVALEGGTNAAPSATGLAAKAALLIKGWTVTTN